jgi:short-subunit dehydrogenase
MIRLHAEVSIRLTHAVLQHMAPRQRGSIINVSSIAGFVPRPGNANYAATKAYLNTFSLALAEELRGTGVRVQALCPGFTLTEFHDSGEYDHFDRAQVPRFLWMSAEAVARASLRALEGGRVIVIPGRWNRLIVRMAQNPFTRRILLHPRFRARRN